MLAFTSLTAPVTTFTVLYLFFILLFQAGFSFRLFPVPHPYVFGFSPAFRTAVPVVLVDGFESCVANGAFPDKEIIESEQDLKPLLGEPRQRDDCILENAVIMQLNRVVQLFRHGDRHFGLPAYPVRFHFPLV